MTASSTPPGSPHPPPGGSADPSMEDILASIRRILSEDEGEPLPSATHPATGPDVVPLDPSMLVEEPPPPMPHVPEEPPTVIAPSSAPPPPVNQPPVNQPPANLLPANPPPHIAPVGLVGPEAAAAAASSVGSLLRTLASERQQIPVRSGGPTIEDLVREEIRPLLKAWLDANLPPLVERHVRTEIERVVGRALS